LPPVERQNTAAYRILFYEMAQGRYCQMPKSGLLEGKIEYFRKEKENGQDLRDRWGHTCLEDRVGIRVCT